MRLRRLSTFVLALAVLTPALAQQPQDPNTPPPPPPPEQTEPQTPPAPAEPPQAAPEEPVAPPPVAEPVPITLGQLALKIAAAMKLQPPATGFTPESAAWALTNRGIKIRPDLAAQVTEADAVSVLAALGYKVRTTTPSRLMTSDRIDLVIETFIQPGKP